MASYSSNFGNMLQMMVGIAKEYGFTPNFDMPRSFTPRRSDIQAKMAKLIRLPNGLLYPRVEVEQRTHSGDDIDFTRVFQLETSFSPR